MVKGLFDAQLGLAGHGGGNVRRLGQMEGIPENVAGDGCHNLGTVDEGKALLGRQLNCWDSGGLHGLSARHTPALVFSFALAQHHQH